MGTLIAGVIHDPAKDELFIAERGKGAFLNNRRLRVSGRIDVVDGVFATGIPTISKSNHPAYLKKLAGVMARSSGIRRMGAAALDLAYVAAGRYDGYWENGLQTWDMAAGIVLVREAGGFVSDLNGKDLMMDSHSLVCGNEAMHKILLDMVKDA